MATFKKQRLVHDGLMWPTKYEDVPVKKRYKLQWKDLLGVWHDAHENDMNGELDGIMPGDDAVAYLKEKQPNLDIRFVLVLIP